MRSHDLAWHCTSRLRNVTELAWAMRRPAQIADIRLPFMLSDQAARIRTHAERILRAAQLVPVTHGKHRHQTFAVGLNEEYGTLYAYPFAGANMTPQQFGLRQTATSKR